MTSQQRKRLLELLIKEVDATGVAEGKWYSSKADVFELQKLLIEFDPNNESRKDSLRRFLSKNPKVSVLNK